MFIATLPHLAGAQGIRMTAPLAKPRIVKKRTKRFKRHQSDRKITVKVRPPASLGLEAYVYGVSNGSDVLVFVVVMHA